MMLIYPLCWPSSRDDKQIYRARIKLSNELKKRRIIQQVESLEVNEEISTINSMRISAIKKEKCRSGSRMSSFITKQILNGEQLVDETINLTLKILKNSNPTGVVLKILLWDQFNNVLVIKRISLKHFTLIINQHQWVVNLYMRYFKLLIVTVAWKMKRCNCFQNIQVNIKLCSEYIPLHHWCFLVVSKIKMGKAAIFSSINSFEFNCRGFI